MILIVFGANRLPEIGSGMGKAIRGFKDATGGKDAIDVTPKESKETEEKAGEQKG
ncbi:MAG: twin-arginine translocase TatA/TatE family subunit [Candidatus Methylomirabilales bacterium]